MVRPQHPDAAGECVLVQPAGGGAVTARVQDHAVQVGGLQGCGVIAAQDAATSLQRVGGEVADLALVMQRDRDDREAVRRGQGLGVVGSEEVPAAGEHVGHQRRGPGQVAGLHEVGTEVARHLQRQRVVRAQGCAGEVEGLGVEGERRGEVAEIGQ